jgi:hypothetical protein
VNCGDAVSSIPRDMGEGNLINIFMSSHIALRISRPTSSVLCMRVATP